MRDQAKQKARCYVCAKMDQRKNLVTATFTEDHLSHQGHRLCFQECNKDLVASHSPFRWKISGDQPIIE